MRNMNEHSADEWIDKLHQNLQEILDYIDGICRDHGLKYLLTGGTALGAVRHGDFIPWDDDMDIAMPREDYDKFIQIALSNNDGKYYLQNADNEEHYFLPFVKIRKKGTIFREFMAPDVYINNGIYVDVFPIDYTDSIDSLGFKLNYGIIKLLEGVVRFKECKGYYKDTKSTLKYACIYAIIFPFWYIDNKKILSVIDRRMKSRNGNVRKFMVSYGGIYKINKESWPIQVILPPKPLAFGKKNYLSCADVKEYLTITYGDYMILPSEDKRHTHEPIELKFSP